MSGTVFIYVTRAAPNKGSIGATNGIAQLAASVIRAMGPAAATSIFALSVDHDWLHGYGVYAIYMGLSCLLMLVGLPLPHHGWTSEVSAK